MLRAGSSSSASFGEPYDFGDDGDDVDFIGFDDVTGSEPLPERSPFDPDSPRSSQASDDYDPVYAERTRRQLQAAIDESDAARFGEDLGDASSAPHIVEAAQWHAVLGSLRVVGRACLPGTLHGGGEVARGRGGGEDSESSYYGSDDEGSDCARPDVVPRCAADHEVPEAMDVHPADVQANALARAAAAEVPSAA